MFIRIFRTESAVQFIIILLLGILLWLPAWLQPPVQAPYASFLTTGKVFFQALTHYPVLSSILALVVIVTQGIVLTLILSNHDLAPRNNALPAILYLLLMSWHPNMLAFHSTLIANAFLILFLFEFLQIYEKPDAFKEVFTSCFAIALATLFQSSAVILMVLVWFGFIIYRVFSWREWIISLTGFFLPFLFYALYEYWNDTWLIKIEEIRVYFSAYHLIPLHFTTSEIIIFTVFSFLTLATVVRVMQIIQEKVISIRKKFIFLVWFLVLTSAIFFFSPGLSWQNASMAILPLTILVSYHFSLLKKLFWWEILFTMLLIGFVWIRLFNV